MPEDKTPALEDGPVGPSKTWLDILERLAKVFAIVAIPVVIPLALAIYSAKVQKGEQSETINRDYVQLAVSLLKEKKSDVDPDLRDWAVDLLASHSPTPFRPEVIQKLKSGDASLPAATNSTTRPGAEAVSPDGKLYAFANGIGGVEVVDTASRKSVLRFFSGLSTVTWQLKARDLFQMPQIH
jgi:hypothetical protein